MNPKKTKVLIFNLGRRQLDFKPELSIDGKSGKSQTCIGQLPRISGEDPDRTPYINLKIIMKQYGDRQTDTNI